MQRFYEYHVPFESQIANLSKSILDKSQNPIYWDVNKQAEKIYMLETYYRVLYYVNLPTSTYYLLRKH